MLPSIELQDLEAVAGGQNTTTVRRPNGTETSTNLTDYAYCASKVEQSCIRENTGFFGTDQAKAGQCIRESLPKACGLPPAGQ